MDESRSENQMEQSEMDVIDSEDFSRLRADAEKGDPFAMYYLAMGYESGIFEEAFDEGYLYWLKEFMDSQIVNAYLEEWDPEEECTEEAALILGFNDEFDLRGKVIDVGTRLGLYYKKSSKYDELLSAEKYLDAVFIAGKDFFLETGEGELLSVLEEINLQANQIRESVFSNDATDFLLAEEKEKLKMDLGEAWELFTEQTQTGVLTAEACYRVFSGVSLPYDFTSVITPLMKSLEYELKLHFYNPYRKFLKENYSVDEFAGKISRERGFEKNKIAVKRRKLVTKSNGDLRYVSDDDPRDRTSEFSIGEFLYTIGTTDKPQLLKNIQLDSTFLDFCQNGLYSEYEPEDVRNWILSIVKELKDMRKLRNESAHGGLVQNQADAETARATLIHAKRILVLIVAPDFVNM